MKRRDFLHLSKTGIILGATSSSAHAIDSLIKEDEEVKLQLIQEEACADALIDPNVLIPREDDIIASTKEYKILYSLYKRLRRLQRTVGHAHFNVLNFDDAIKTAKWYSKVGAFPKAEIDFFEELFYEAAQNYGFFGEKVIVSMTNDIKKRELVKVRRSGHYLFKGDSLDKYNEIKKVMGKKVILTSGVRNIVKQTYLFLNKVVKSKGNLSVASRSLAPAGYSYHGISDFDIGKVGFGARNFTAAFAKTSEYKTLRKLGYIDIRYPKNNPFGVRYEPWHIKVYSDT
jgi:zinc D-Ala-D-Ala carboxypeptidase